MAGPCHVEHVEVILRDGTVQVHVGEILARRGAPMTDHQRLDVRQLQRLLEQRIVIEIDLSHGHIIGGAPIGIDPAQVVGGQIGVFMIRCFRFRVREFWSGVGRGERLR